MSIISKIKSLSRTSQFLYCAVLVIILILLAYCSYRTTHNYLCFFFYMIDVLPYIGLPLVIIGLLSEYVIKKRSKKEIVKRQPSSSNSCSNQEMSNNNHFPHFGILVFIWILSVASTLLMGIFSILGLLILNVPQGGPSQKDSFILLLICLVAAIVCTVKSVIKGRQCIYPESFRYGIAPPLLLLFFIFHYFI